MKIVNFGSQVSWLNLFSLLILMVVILCNATSAYATSISNGPVNVSAQVISAPPTTPAVIQSPLNNTIVSLTPMVASGSCAPGLEVRLYDNGTLVGSTTCSAGGTFVINFTLVPGVNDLTALNFDLFEQSGPASPTVTVIVVSPDDEGIIPIPKNNPATPNTPKTDNPPSASPVDPKTGLPIKPAYLRPAFVSIAWFLFVLLCILLIAIADISFNKKRILNRFHVWQNKKRSKTNK